MSRRTPSPLPPVDPFTGRHTIRLTSGWCRETGLSQELAYALSLAEASNGRHAIVVGTTFTRILMRNPQEVAIESGEDAQAEPSVRPVRVQLLATVRHAYLGHLLLDSNNGGNLEALQRYLGARARSTPASTRSARTSPSSKPTTKSDFDQGAAFSLDRTDRLRVIATARKAKLSGTASEMENEEAEEEDEEFNISEPEPSQWADFIDVLDRTRSYLATKRVLDDYDNLQCTRVLFWEALEQLENAGYRFVVVDPEEMERLLDIESAADEKRCAERHRSQDPVGFRTDENAAAPLPA